MREILRTAFVSLFTATITTEKNRPLLHSCEVCFNEYFSIPQAKPCLLTYFRSTIHIMKYGTRPTLTQVTDLLLSLSSAFKALYVVVDALDECAESEENSLHFMSTVLSIGPQVKVLCTSRFSTTFTAYFAQTERLEIFAQDEDVRMFLASEISRQSMLSRHIQADPNLKTDIVDTIAEQCKGMYAIQNILDK